MFEIVYRYDPMHPLAEQPPQTAEEARQRLEAGNRSFAHVLDHIPRGQATARRVIPFDPRDLGVGDAAGAAPRQQPFAVVLGCSDARVPTELIFNQWCNELFVVRVAGNGLGGDALGSVDYAVANLGPKLLVVLAHSGCGAVTAAVDVFLRPAQYLGFADSHALRTIIDRLVVVVRGAATALDLAWGDGVRQRPGYRQALIALAVALNGALTAFTLKRELARRQGTPTVTTVFGVYDLSSRRVTLPDAPVGAAADEIRLVEPPDTTEAFAELTRRLAAAAVIARRLDGG